MASINPETAWEFADAIKSVLKLPTTRRRATVQSVDKDGTIWVQLPGSSTTTPIASTGANVAPGDTVLTELRGTSLHITENNTDPAVGTRQAGDIARQAAKPAVDAAKAAHEIAAEAQAVADATNQHFWDDDNGAHVTDVTQDEWTAAAADDFSDLSDAKPYHNLLMNSLGILLRRALYNLVSISKSAIAFYDGVGNGAANIVAGFGADGAQIGKIDESHMTLDYHSMKMVDKEGSTYLHVSDLRDESGYLTIHEEHDFTPTGTSIGFVTDFAIREMVSLTVNGEESEYTKVDYDTEALDYSIVWIAVPTAGADYHVDCTYRVDSNKAKAYTLGIRGEGRVAPFSHAFGYNVVASGRHSFAAGFGATAQSQVSTAFGRDTIAKGNASFAIGNGSKTGVGGVTGDYAFAGGLESIASEMLAFAFGNRVLASAMNQFVIGKWNIEDARSLLKPNGVYAFIVGNGTNNNARSNAFAIRWNGLTDVAGRTAYPLFVYSTAPDEADLPVTPCFVLATSDYGLWYYDGN